MGDIADPREARLLNEFQRGFPLVHEPYAVIARRLAVEEAWVRATLTNAIAERRVSRVGAVFRPGAVGVSTLAALAVPDAELTRIATLVSARPEVNHNYEREHHFNLWFVATAADGRALDATLDAIGRDAGSAPMSLPLIADYWIDLGFDLSGTHAKRTTGLAKRRDTLSDKPEIELTDEDRRLVDALSDGLPVARAPYADVAGRAGVSEAYVLARIDGWLDMGVIKRFGIVVRHRELGYTANAMCVWDVADDDVDALGFKIAQEPGVTLCYQRRPARPVWPYNLFCMIHGTDRSTVEVRLAEIAAMHGLDPLASAVLFSRRAFKQCGARYALGSPLTSAAA